MATPPDELFTVPPEEFIRTRDALATKLTKAGHSAEATAVRRLQKPTSSGRSWRIMSRLAAPVHALIGRAGSG
jgi:hypothetical protein